MLFCGIFDWVGRHPVTGFSADNDGMDVAHGATLVVSQGAKGDVIVLMYPFESHKGRLKRPCIIWKHFFSPIALSEDVLIEMMRDFMIYARTSSVMMAESATDARRLDYLENRSRADKTANLPSFISMWLRQGHREQYAS